MCKKDDRNARYCLFHGSEVGISLILLSSISRLRILQTKLLTIQAQLFFF